MVMKSGGANAPEGNAPTRLHRLLVATYRRLTMVAAGPVRRISRCLSGVTVGKRAFRFVSAQGSSSGWSPTRSDVPSATGP